MSEENVELVRSMLAPLGGVDVGGIDWGGCGDEQILEQNYSPDVELRTMQSAVGIGPSALYRGVDGVAQYLQEWFEPFSEYRMDFLDWIDAGDRVIVSMRARGVGAGSGVPVDMELTLSHEVRDGRITRLDQYDTAEDALKAAGLS
jgi:ketosteroid isomerase-like protein